MDILDELREARERGMSACQLKVVKEIEDDEKADWDLKKLFYKLYTLADTYESLYVNLCHNHKLRDNDISRAFSRISYDINAIKKLQNDPKYNPESEEGFNEFTFRTNRLIKHLRENGNIYSKYTPEECCEVFGNFSDNLNELFNDFFTCLTEVPDALYTDEENVKHFSFKICTWFLYPSAKPIEVKQYLCKLKDGSASVIRWNGAKWVSKNNEVERFTNINLL